MAGSVSVTQGETGVTSCFCGVVMASVVTRCVESRHVNFSGEGAQAQASRREAAVWQAQSGRAGVLKAPRFAYQDLLLFWNEERKRKALSMTTCRRWLYHTVYSTSTRRVQCCGLPNAGGA